MKKGFRFVGIALLVLTGVFGFLWVRHYIEEKAETEEAQTDGQVAEDQDGADDNTDDQPPASLIRFNEAPAFAGAEFFEKQPIIQGQQAYIAIPMEYDLNTPPTIVLYSHGSDTTITKSLTSDFMQQMQDYGEFFTSNNYIFAASAMHGANWGSDASVADMLNLIELIKAEYTTEEKVDLLGFSMGGWPTFAFAFAHPELVSHIASLAGTSKPSTWTNQQIQTLIPIQVKIWHGDADVNVKYSTSQKMVEKCADNGVDAELITVEGGTHYDVDWEYHEEILEFFEE